MIERALKANPSQWKANALAGTIAFNRKQYAKAVEYRERARANVAPGSPIAQSIAGSIEEARQLGAVLGSGFRLVRDHLEDHITPAGRRQQFLYGWWQTEPGAS